MDGVIRSSFTTEGEKIAVTTACDPDADRFTASIEGKKHLPIAIRFAYPTGAHTDDASNWAADEKHSTELVASTEQSATLLRTIDTARYYVRLDWTGKATIAQKGRNHFTLTPRRIAGPSLPTLRHRRRRPRPSSRISSPSRVLPPRSGTTSG